LIGPAEAGRHVRIAQSRFLVDVVSGFSRTSKVAATF